MLELTDTHCHIHEAGVGADNTDPTQQLWAKVGANPDQLITNARQNGVTRLICVGCTLADSQRAVAFVQGREGLWASVGVHPHEAESGQKALQGIADLLGLDWGPVTQDSSPQVLAGVPAVRQRAPLLPATPFLSASRRKQNKIVAIGEIGLDYFYNHSTKAEQIKALRFQIELALRYDLPIIFHVREAFDDFWPIFDSYKGIRGVLHSFTDNHANFTKAMERGLHIGINGIVTFTKVDEQLQIAKEVPLQKLLLETDAPYLTPVPHRGKVNEPSQVRLVAEFLADLRRESLQTLVEQTTKNAKTLFSLS